MHFYRDFRNRNGEQLFKPDYDAEKWKAAAEAIDEAIALCEQNGYELISGNKETVTPLLNTMRDLELSIWSPNYKSTEGIMMVSTSDLLYRNTLPSVGTSTSNIHYDPNIYGDIGTNIKMVETFYTKNGLPIDQDNTWDYERTLHIGEGRTIAIIKT